MKIIQRISNFVLAAFLLCAATRPAPSSRADALEMLQFTSGDHRIGFDDAGMLIAAGDHALRVDFVNANATNPASASTEGGVFASTTYANLWDGVTLTYDAVGIVRSTYEVAAHARADAIRLRYNRPVELLADGSLQIEFETGAMTESAPVAWQESNGKRQPVAVAFRQLGEREVGFALGAYDRSRPLFIDPVLGWNTFMGSGVFDSIEDMVMSADGYIYVTGSSSATWGTPVRAYSGGKDVFVAKLSPTGTRIWHTFLGSSATDLAGGVALRTDGAYVFVTGSSNGNWGVWPIRPYVWIYDIFVAGVNTLDGTLQWNTFLGGFGDDYGSDLVSTNTGVYIVGYSSATWGGPLTAYAGGSNDAELIKLNTAGSLFWSTFMGSTGADYGYGVDTDTTVDIDASLFVTGYSNTTWGTPVNTHAGANDAFVAKFNENGARQWNTFMGSSAEDYGYNIVTATNGDSFVVGSSGATWGTPVAAFAGGFDGFAAKLDTNGARAWNTFFGSATQDQAYAIAMDSSSNLYVAGISDSTWGAPIKPHGGGLNDAFIGVFNSGGIRQRNTFVGGNGGDVISDLAVNSAGALFAGGHSNATWGSPINPFNANYDGFVAMFHQVKSMMEYSVGASDGWVLESTETSAVGGSISAAGTTFHLGDDAQDRQYRAILSFNTGSLPNNAVITRVILKIKKFAQVGADPFASLGALRVDIRKSGFSGSFSLEPSDFQSAASKANIGAIPNAPVNDWYTKAWTTDTFFSFINRAGTTQFRLGFATDDNDNATADYIRFFSGDHVTVGVRPVLIIEYYVP